LEERQNLFRYLGQEVTGDELPWILIQLAFESVAAKAIIPLQDILNLGQVARMNKPGTVGGNWQWRFTADMLTPSIRAKLADLTVTSQRE